MLVAEKTLNNTADSFKNRCSARSKRWNNLCRRRFPSIWLMSSKRFRSNRAEPIQNLEVFDTLAKAAAPGNNWN